MSTGDTITLCVVCALVAHALTDCWRHLQESKRVDRILEDNRNDFKIMCSKHDNEVLCARAEGWKEGRLYQLRRTTPKRDASGRFETKKK